MLTDTACRRAKPTEKPYKLADARGLHLYVTPTGYKSWRWKYRLGGKEKRLVFGPYPDISLAEARELREDAARELRQGHDPAVRKLQRSAAQAAQLGSSFEKMARAWHASEAPTWSPRYASIILNGLTEDVFPKLGTVPIAAVTTPMIVGVLRPIEARGAVETAHRTKQRISAIFEYAIGNGVVEANPATVAGRGLRKPKKGKFPAVRTVTAARSLLRTVEAEPAHPVTKLASRLLALTAVRSGVLRLAEPGEFEGLDGADPVWRVPAAKMKLVQERKEDVAFEFLVPLSTQAVEVVKVAMAFARGGPLLFPSVRSSRRPISDSTLSKLYRMAGFSGIHVPHGWRSTFSTVLNELAGAENRVGDRAIIDLMLAHIPEGVEAVYNRAAYMPRRRQLAQEWADMLVQDLVPADDLLVGPRHS